MIFHGFQLWSWGLGNHQRSQVFLQGTALLDTLSTHQGSGLKRSAGWKAVDSGGWFFPELAAATLGGQLIQVLEDGFFPEQNLNQIAVIKI